MNNIKSAVWVLCLFMIFSCNSKSEIAGAQVSFVMDEEKAKKEILQLIENETECFFKRDFECWQKHFAQKNYAFQAWNNSDGSVDANVGWEKINKKVGIYIENNPLGLNETSSHPLVIKKNIKWKFYCDHLAYMMWDQYNQSGKEFQHSKEARLIEKVNGEWKIVNVSAFWDYKNAYSPEQVESF